MLHRAVVVVLALFVVGCFHDDNAQPSSRTSALGLDRPIVLVHGFMGFAKTAEWDYFFRVPEALQDAGYRVFVPALPPLASTEGRALRLGLAIEDAIAKSGADKVHLIAHSQGGLDARYLLGFYPEVASKVASLITIGTPHHGTPIADLAAKSPPGVMNGAGHLMAWLFGVVDAPPNAWDLSTEDVPGLGLVPAVEQLTSVSQANFNETVPPTNVPLYSVAGYSNLRGAPAFCKDALWPNFGGRDAVDPMLVASGLYLSGVNLLFPKSNDGVVPSTSARYGTLLACIPADHFDQVGQILDFTPGLLSDFDHRKFYLQLANFAASQD